MADNENNYTKEGILRAICISPERGTEKQEVRAAKLIENWGIEGDAHGGRWHRQISLLAYEKIEEFKAKGAEVYFGAFGENIVTEGIDLRGLRVGSTLNIGKTIIRITQKGKECHNHCRIFKKMGSCIMPKEGIFGEVLKGGEIAVGDRIFVKEPDSRAFTAAVVTLSDKGYKGEREDLSGALAENMLKEAGYEVVERLLLPDDFEAIKKELIRLCDGREVNLIITTGGTGFSKRDVTPEATLAVCERQAAGISEAIRAFSMTVTKRAMLSRGEAGIRGESLIVNLPGSPKAVGEGLGYILPTLKHGLKILTGKETECGGKNK